MVCNRGQRRSLSLGLSAGFTVLGIVVPGAGLLDLLVSPLVVRAYTRFGDDLPSRLLGDFAFALWDARHGRLLCARDRLGLKPFHYVWRDGVFRFASELRPLLAALPRVETDDEMVLAFLLREFRPGDEHRTFVAGVHRLAPGHALIVDRDGPRRVRYWAPDPARRLGVEVQLIERFLETLRQDGWRRVSQGKTTIEEVVRVTQTDEVMAETTEEAEPVVAS